ncbi:MAG: sulfatase activating formylglycine-generating enzyme, partial [Pseudohongiellaceae bacterium]
RQGREEVSGFRIARFEVSNGQYAKFLEYVNKTGDHSYCDSKERVPLDHTPEQWDIRSKGADNVAVVGVDWWSATAYASWAGLRLPSYVEWTRAGRADSERLFPWGDVFAADLCHSQSSGVTGPTNVNEYPGGRSAFGLYQMAGNAAEWLGLDPDQGDNAMPFLNGGGWDKNCETRSVVQFGLLESRGYQDASSGFRCAADLP